MTTDVDEGGFSIPRVMDLENVNIDSIRNKRVKQFIKWLEDMVTGDWEMEKYGSNMQDLQPDDMEKKTLGAIRDFYFCYSDIQVYIQVCKKEIIICFQTYENIEKQYSISDVLMNQTFMDMRDEGFYFYSEQIDDTTYMDHTFCTGLLMFMDLFNHAITYIEDDVENHIYVVKNK